MNRGSHGRCNHQGGHVPLHGIQSSGEFTTARAKIYPEALNKTLAAAISGFLHDAQINNSCHPVPEELQQLASNDFSDVSHVQPDYYH